MGEYGSSVGGAFGEDDGKSDELTISEYDAPVWVPLWLIQTELERDRERDHEKWVALFYVWYSHCKLSGGIYFSIVQSRPQSWSRSSSV